MASLEQQFINLVQSARDLALLADHYWAMGMTVQARDTLRQAEACARRVLIIASSSPFLAEKYRVQRWAMYRLTGEDQVGKEGVSEGP